MLRSLAPIFGLLTLCWGFAPAASAGSLIETQLYSGDMASALAIAQSQAKANPADLAAQEMWIDLLIMTGQVQKAETVTSQRVHDAPRDPNAHYLHARAATTARDSRIRYERALRIDPEHGRSFMGMASVHEAEGRSDDALAAYQNAVERDPSLEEAWMGLIRQHLMRNDAPSAASAVQRGMKAVPDAGGLYLVLALIQPQQAEATLRAGLRQDGGDARIPAALAEVLLTKGEADAALVFSRQALVIDPANRDALLVEMFSEAIAAGVLDIEGHRGLVQARETQNQSAASALPLFQDLVNRYPDCALTFLGRAAVFDELGRSEEALSDLARALQRDPSLTEAQAVFGMALLRAERASEAAPWLAKATRSRPWDATLSVAYGQALRQTGDLQAATAHLAKAVDARPWDVESIILLAETLQAAQRPLAAYAVVKEGMLLTSSPQLVAAFVLVAADAGRHEEAATLVENLAARSGSKVLEGVAQRLRAQAGQ